MPYKDGDLKFYLYGEKNAPAGAGKGAQVFTDLLQIAKKTGKKFEDPFSPANSSSLGDVGLKYSNGHAMEIKWQRPTEIAQSLFMKSPVFAENLSQFGVNQGSVGDCWFLAVLADVAIKPDCINTIVPEDNKNVGFDMGIFHFRIWCKGKWVDVVVDDRLPCVMSQQGKIRTTAFCKPTADGGFWSPLFEKAYAKVYGKYENIKGGFGTDAMLDFTGGYIQSFGVDFKDLIENLSANIQLDAIMAIGTKTDISKELLAAPNAANPGSEKVSKEGIVLGHEYSLIDIHDVVDKTDPKKVTTLFKLRNPWGNATEWTGDFSDLDPHKAWSKVTPDLRKKTDKVNDGQFWISWESLKPYVGRVDMCRWSSKFRGDENIKAPNGACFYTVRGNFPPENSGPVTKSGALRGKGGVYIHLKAINPKAQGEVIDGLNYNCTISVMAMYLDYKSSGLNEDVPTFGIYLLWAPGYLKPDGDGFFQHVKKFTSGLTSRVRLTNKLFYLPEGTALIVPWLKVKRTDKPPYLLRIMTEGEVFQL